MVRFAPLLTGDAELAGKVTSWLVEQHDYFGRAYLHHPAEVQKAPADSPWKRAERAWVDWMNASFDGLPDQKKTTLVDILDFTMPFNNDEGIVWNDFAYPGLKTYDMGLRIIDRWRAAGHPVANSKSRGEPQQILYDKIVSPIQRNRQGYRSVEVFQSRKNWYFHAMRTEDLKRRLLGDILSRKDDVFTETAFANLLRVNSNLGHTNRHERKDDWQDFLFFWRGIEADDKMWRIATRVLAENELGGAAKSAIYDESVKIWRHNPRERGALLYLLALNSSPSDDIIPWDRWAQVAGAPINAKELGDFLDMDTQTISALPTIWRALGRGYPKGDLIASRLGRFVEDARTRARNFQDPTHSITEVVHRLREEGATADLAKIHAFLKQRVAEHPSEQREFETLLDLTKK